MQGMCEIALTDSENEALTIHGALQAVHVACVISTVLRGPTPEGTQDNLYQLFVRPEHEHLAREMVHKYYR